MNVIIICDSRWLIFTWFAYLFANYESANFIVPALLINVCPQTIELSSRLIVVQREAVPASPA